jgi:hypothetical protein
MDFKMSNETETKTLVDALIFAVSHAQLSGVPKWVEEQQQLLQALKAISAKYGEMVDEIERLRYRLASERAMSRRTYGQS